MRFTNLTQVSRSMLAAILAASIAFPVPAIAFAADTDNAPDESAIDSAESSQDGPAGTSEQGGNDPERFSGLIEGEDYSGLLITLDADASVSLRKTTGTAASRRQDSPSPTRSRPQTGLCS